MCVVGFIPNTRTNSVGRTFFFLRWDMIYVEPQYETFFFVTPFLAPRIFRWLADFWKICGPLTYVTCTYNFSVATAV